MEWRKILTLKLSYIVEENLTVTFQSVGYRITGAVLNMNSENRTWRVSFKILITRLVFVTNIIQISGT